MALQRGQAHKFGVKATLTAVATGSISTKGGQTGSAIGAAYITDYTLGYSADTILTKAGSDGDYVSRIDHGHAQTAELTVLFYDSDGTPGITHAEAQFVVPSKGTTIAITDSSDPQIAGNWIVESSSKRATVDGVGTGTISCWRNIGGSLADTSAIVT